MFLLRVILNKAMLLTRVNPVPPWLRRVDDGETWLILVPPVITMMAHVGTGAITAKPGLPYGDYCYKT